MNSGRIYPFPKEGPEAFTARVKPSKTSPLCCEWIQCHGPDRCYDDETTNLNLFLGVAGPLLFQLNKALDSLPKGSRKKAIIRAECCQQLYAAASEHNQTCGKWMLFLKTEHIDKAWETVAEMTMRGHLGHSAKVAPMFGLGIEERGLICVYYKDFNDEDAVLHGLAVLKSMNLNPVSFKCDFFTNLGLNSNNAYGLSITTYNAKGEKLFGNNSSRDDGASSGTISTKSAVSSSSSSLLPPSESATANLMPTAKSKPLYSTCFIDLTTEDEPPSNCFLSAKGSGAGKKHEEKNYDEQTLKKQKHKHEHEHTEEKNAEEEREEEKDK